jgi:hypothetical protein
MLILINAVAELPDAAANIAVSFPAIYRGRRMNRFVASCLASGAVAHWRERLGPEKMSGVKMPKRLLGEWQ